MGRLNQRDDPAASSALPRLAAGAATAVALGVAALARIQLGRWSDARNIEALRRRYDLDDPTATRLYRLARAEGFGSAWQQVIGDRDRGDPQPPSR